MIAAFSPSQRPADAKLLVVDRSGRIGHRARAALVGLLRPGDLVVANDAATIPAALPGRHLASGRHLEVRLAGCQSLDPGWVKRVRAVLFGLGDFRMRTEDRPLPPLVTSGDRLTLGPLRATITGLLNHPRLVTLEFDGSPSQIWEGLARHGRPIQYSHVPSPLMMWDTWTAVAAAPLAFEPPSAGFVLDWQTLAALRARGIEFASLTHAAGISSSGDPDLDRLLPFDEPYRIPVSTVRAIERAKQRSGRIVAIGTTVVRALEHAAGADGVIRAGDGLATQRIGGSTRLRTVDAIVSGTHEPGTSHYELLRAFTNDRTLGRVGRELNARGYRTHEFGDSLFIEALQRERRPAPLTCIAVAS